MLGEQHSGLPLLVEAPQQPHQLIARNGVELRGGLVEQDQGRPAGERGGERHALLLAAREVVRGAVQQMIDPER